MAFYLNLGAGYNRRAGGIQSMGLQRIRHDLTTMHTQLIKGEIKRLAKR